MNKEKIKAAVQQAKDYVSSEEEPWKSLAFQVILTKLISADENIQTLPRMQSEKPQSAVKSKEMEEDLSTLSIPQKSLEKILSLKEREQIPILWSLSSKPSMTVDEFLSLCEKAGITIPPSYSPTKGGNFRNRLVKEDKMFVEDGKVGKVSMYKLSAAGRLKAQKFLEDSE